MVNCFLGYVGADDRAEDLQWWTGWNTTTTRRALGHLAIEEVDLHGQPGIDLLNPDEDVADEAPNEPVAALLPNLDPIPMGWKTRDWFLGIDPRHVFDGAVVTPAIRAPLERVLTHRHSSRNA